MKILISAYGLNPYGVSESYSGFKWVEILASNHEVWVVTPTENIKYIKDYYKDIHMEIPFEIVGIDLREKKIKSNFLYSAVKIDYFLFNALAYHRICNLKVKFDYILHRNPVGIRYPNKLSKIDSNFIIGPLSGGLDIPNYFKDIKKSEGVLTPLIRKLDKIQFYVNPFLRSTYDRADKIIISNDYLKDVLPKKYEKKMIKILETGIDTESYKSHIYEDNECIKLLFVGRMVPYKGLDLLLKAILYMDKQELNFKLDVLGDGERLENFKKFVRENNLGKYIEFHGKVSKEVVKKFFNECDIFCFPSLKEAVGNVILEAMAMSKAIICADIGGPSEILDAECSKKIKICEESEFINLLSKELKNLILDKNTRTLLGKNARQKVVEEYDWKEIEKKILTVFN